VSRGKSWGGLETDIKCLDHRRLRTVRGGRSRLARCGTGVAQVMWRTRCQVDVFPRCSSLFWNCVYPLPSLLGFLDIRSRCFKLNHVRRTRYLHFEATKIALYTALPRRTIAERMLFLAKRGNQTYQFSCGFRGAQHPVCVPFIMRTRPHGRRQAPYMQLVYS
jgi:hypothetical protein